MSAGLITIYAALLGLAYLAGTGLYFEMTDMHKRQSLTFGRKILPRCVKTQRRS